MWKKLSGKCVVMMSCGSFFRLWVVVGRCSLRMVWFRVGMLI